ncbi:C2H2-type zinc finger protein KNAG_0I02070 [Huiozyma naganishii CBS 8797]|uniref:C2H2-type domain-containing protein n=1 Tax=Huiozyma naganishii (strain ATCC MYA-139 / BCRC 22969 / CBS 8797 / KCTC 17520 / NBRC 10181 / NCYC 3082 / Yp74L-3) TaxID=1071383 RepID=J7S2G1_HUIN7|nr:hypothetical protein KNAG_0I02070 [Kazachstania naganishii CBS 8797]CCK71992.1 hypothetical protein KNAG_0I02070 [Kazachstania naganishii CBS 8797]
MFSDGSAFGAADQTHFPDRMGAPVSSGAGGDGAGASGQGSSVDQKQISFSEFNPLTRGLSLLGSSFGAASGTPTGAQIPSASHSQSNGLNKTDTATSSNNILHMFSQNNSSFSSKRDSTLILNGTDSGEMDFFSGSFNKRNLMFINSKQQIGNSNAGGIPQSQSQSQSGGRLPSANNLELDTFFTSAQNSMRFPSESDHQYDSQEEGRSSSLKPLLDPLGNPQQSRPGIPSSLSRLSSLVNMSNQGTAEEEQTELEQSNTPPDVGSDATFHTEQAALLAKVSKTKPRQRRARKLRAKPSGVSTGTFLEVSSAAGAFDHSDDSQTPLGATTIDQLMLVVEARKKGVTDRIVTTNDGRLLLDANPEILPRRIELVGGVEKPIGANGIKQHECNICHKLFIQLTHLEVHLRSHLGDKPYKCTWCGKGFTQGGNLKTHVRLHTGEKPFSCEFCSKRFSRKGNLTAHLVTHEKVRPFVCKLNGCMKTFTQLGNMKSHQNRFHQNTLTELTRRLANLDPAENISAEEREMLNYFASLYKNSNKGIKGRGRGKNTQQDKSRTATPTQDLIQFKTVDYPT